MADTILKRVMLDTNVLLDYLLHRDNHAQAAEMVINLGIQHNIGLLCTSLSLKDVAYISGAAVKRQFKPNDSGGSELENVTRNLLAAHVPWRCIQQVHDLCEVIAITNSTCDYAFSLKKKHKDFEDNLIIAAAKQSNADCVVTSDAELIEHFPEYCKTPKELIAEVSQHQ
ncbi:PIN domain-containing protein [Bifidobacterium imperatoris]|uniref:PIN domain-containing protein n=1 Tax=Bifidobacterium imperatoris TaxID=2020965 RepID=A0A2N5IVD1_9BIFI|nr:PIN domain-containing protein [Bifidobacterium imperatoris]PLS25896.1 twitching motility protein PilT [Bifidobacterium imperatoris]QSY57631.1 PIN domain-containing protein [Bifidobacterium imperatoris]